MDYEKKYKEALERAKVIYQGSYKPDTAATIAETLQNVFPELKESEDEKISKEIIKYLERTVPHHHRDEVLKSKEWIAWLENIPYTIDHEKREGFHLSYKAGLEKQNSDVDNANKEYWRGYREGKQEILDKYAELEKQGEKSQRMVSAEAKEAMYSKPAWSEEDEKKLRGICNYISCSDSPEGFEEWIDWLNSLKDRYTWKPSEEQMDALNSARWNAPFKIEILDSLYNDLKKLTE